MKNKGYIYIITLFIISLMAIFFYFISSFIENSSYINLNRQEKINSKYIAESVLNIALADKDFQKDLYSIALGKEDYINLNSSFSLEYTEVKKLIMKDFSTDDEDIIEIDTNIKYKNSLAAAKIKANYINKIYKNEDGILNSSNIDSNKLAKLKENFNSHNYNGENKKVVELNGDFKIDNQYGMNVVLEEVEEFNEEINDFVKKDKVVRRLAFSDIIYQKSGTLEIKNKANISFLIINDKVMFNDNKLFGIIVLNEGAEISKNCMLDGYLIDLYDKNSSINVNYNYLMVKSYGDVLPEFVKFQPISLNHYDLEN